MQIHLSRQNGVPTYLQIVNQVKYLVASGRLQAGEELPPIRALAEQLVINPNTVARAYRELETAGVVTKRSTTGTYVSDAGSPLARRERLKIVTERIDALLVEARQLDVGTDEIIDLLRQRDKALRGTSFGGVTPMIATSPAPTVIDIQGVTRRFGAKVALDDVVLSVPRGCVFGLVGVNGSGKTTLIKHVLGLLRAETGRVRVFGRDPVADPVGILSRIGYLSEENDLPSWMTVAELIRYTRAFYPAWRDDYAEELRHQFGLDLSSRIGELSKGQQARAGLLVALAYRPELLVLDEPSSGLDPLVRRDILGAIIRTVADEGRTVLFSSHLLDEMERVVDRVAMIDDGRIVLSAGMDEIQANHRRVTLRFAEPLAQPPALSGALSWEGAGHEWTAVWHGPSSAWQEAVSACGARVVEEHGVGLDEIFVARMGRPAAADVTE